MEPTNESVGQMLARTGDDASWADTLRRFGGPDVEEQWARLREACDPVTAAASNLQATARTIACKIVHPCRTRACLPR